MAEPNIAPSEDPKDLVAAIEELQEIVRQRVEFGNPQNPKDPTSTTLAGSGAITEHNGTLSNIRGSWVQVSVTALDSPVVFTHNLDVEFVSATTPNVLWLPMRFVHDGTAALGSSALALNYETGDVVTRNSIELRLYCGTGRTVSVASPVEVTLFFIPAVR